MQGVVQLATTPEDKHHAREALLVLLACQAGSWPAARYLLDGVTQLDPDVSDLSTWRDWAILPTGGLLAVGAPELDTCRLD